MLSKEFDSYYSQDRPGRQQLEKEKKNKNLSPQSKQTNKQEPVWWEDSWKGT